MSKVLISIIVPVYKVEQYLDECVQSILHQSFKDFEGVIEFIFFDIFAFEVNAYNNIRSFFAQVFHWEVIKQTAVAQQFIIIIYKSEEERDGHT